VPERPAVLFVYGTLTRRRQMDAVLAGCSGWRYTGRATIAGELYDVGSYPALRVNGRSAARVTGRLVEVDRGQIALARLDAYEGVGEGLYVRRRRRVRTGGGHSRVAWIYEYARTVDRLPRIARWPSRAGRQCADC
jgi:gamma-glutamylcyclotransferase (GGCT)/AIG2-like uncharacterized protein YtfP